MTCKSERSGMASNGVFFTANNPQTVSSTENINTSERLSIDQRIKCAIKGVPDNHSPDSFLQVSHDPTLINWISDKATVKIPSELGSYCNKKYCN